MIDLNQQTVNGKEHLIGVFDFDGFYSGFITQGAKKYCVEKTIPNEKIQEKYQRVIKRGENESTVLELTVAGVPKQGIYQIKSLQEFKDDLVFEFKNTNKNLLIYCENQDIFDLTDYCGNKELVTDISGCSLIPTTYLLSKSLEYADLISDESTKRARFNYE